MNDQLILRASSHNIAQIRRLLDEIDQAPRRLRITVMQNVDSETAARLTEVNVRLGEGQGKNSFGARVISTRSLENDKKTQQLQVLEGHRARVASGQSVPVTQQVQNAWGTQVITQYRDVDSGFYVLPRVHGESVTLQISAQNDSLVQNRNSGYPGTRTQQTSSTVSGRLGAWIEVGGAGQQSDTDSSTISTRSTSKFNEHVLIKVEEVD